MQHSTPALAETGANLDPDLVSPRGANGNLVQQFGQLRRAGHGLKSSVEPVAQHIGLARAT